MELFVLGLAFGVGAAKRKAVTKAVAKSYMAMSEKTKSIASAMRHDMAEAVAEAREEGERHTEHYDDEAALADAELHDEFLELHEDATSHSDEAEPVAAPKPALSLRKSLARTYVAVTEKTRAAAAGLREEMRDAIEEARYEREKEAQRAQELAAEAAAHAEAEAAHAEEAAHTVDPVVATPTVKRKPKKAAAEPEPAVTKAAKTTRARTAAAKSSAVKGDHVGKTESFVEHVAELAEKAGEMAL